MLNAESNSACAGPAIEASAAVALPVQGFDGNASSEKRREPIKRPVGERFCMQIGLDAAVERKNKKLRWPSFLKRS